MEFPFRIKGSAKFDAVGFGTNAVDFLIRVPEYPDNASKVRLTSYTQMAGGEIASTMCGLQRLGLKTAYAGRFGGDPAGELGIGSLIDEGVDVSSCETIADAQTQIAFIIVDERSGERTVIWNRDPKLAYAASEAPPYLASSGRVLHITPHDAAASIVLAKQAKENGVIVSVDLDNIFDGIAELLPLVDVCIASSELPAKLVGIDDPHAALAGISARYGCAVSGITRGAEGSLFYCEGEYFETPGFAVPGGCVDTTGAGDAFRTGFLYAMLTGESLEQSAAIANAVAALKCRAPGARSGLPRRNELQILIKSP